MKHLKARFLRSITILFFCLELLLTSLAPTVSVEYESVNEQVCNQPTSNDEGKVVAGSAVFEIPYQYTAPQINAGAAYYSRPIEQKVLITATDIITTKEEAPEETQTQFEEYAVPDYSGKKTWMPYTAITSIDSPQYEVQSIAYTGDYGIRMVNDRYCVAIGSYFNASIGQYVDLVLENGTIIPCIKGDAKADGDTDSSNIFTGNGCCSEFIIDYNTLDAAGMQMGDISYVNENWNSKVVKIIVYNTNILE